MTNVVTTSWGKSVEIVQDATQDDGRRIHSGGYNEVNPYGMIPLHIHDDDNEEYIPQTEGMKIIVLSKKEAGNLTESKICEMLEDSEEAEIGDVITCHKGEAHALYNDSDKTGRFVFIKYD